MKTFFELIFCLLGDSIPVQKPLRLLNDYDKLQASISVISASVQVRKMFQLQPLQSFFRWSKIQKFSSELFVELFRVPNKVWPRCAFKDFSVLNDVTYFYLIKILLHSQKHIFRVAWMLWQSLEIFKNILPSEFKDILNWDVIFCESSCNHWTKKFSCSQAFR